MFFWGWCSPPNRGPWKKNLEKEVCLTPKVEAFKIWNKVLGYRNSPPFCSPWSPMLTSTNLVVDLAVAHAGGLKLKVSSRPFMRYGFLGGVPGGFWTYVTLGVVVSGWLAYGNAGRFLPKTRPRLVLAQACLARAPLVGRGPPRAQTSGHPVGWLSVKFGVSSRRVTSETTAARLARLTQFFAKLRPDCSEMLHLE